jgi:hypothetical protein
MNAGHFAIVPALLLLAHCGDAGSEASPSGLGEPLRVRAPVPGTTAKADAQFISGPIVEGTDGPKMPDSLHFNTFVVFPGQAGMQVTGAVETSATAVGVRFADLGTGYWVAPVQAFSKEYDGYLDWTTILEFSSALPLGSHDLEFVGIDELGRHGPASRKALSVVSPVPSGDLVFSLRWDLNADLDLYVTDPNGVQIGTKSHTSLAVADRVTTDFTKPLPPGTGVIDRDSNGGCAIDSIRTEDIVWASLAPAGVYNVYVDMFSACGQPGVTFALDAYRSGTLLASQSGRLLSIDADNGAGPFLLISQFTVTQ